ncbi:TPM domain-containing protein [uncultured Microbacterium sp.]|uniref:TPM domain-containing protein n=1 Tax=uncultured Microbacterium sp. TaxID=191216 RepID=UPI00261C0FB0|nr:TPM domain-containing protein [uncultured Microbacterium sp.]
MRARFTVVLGMILALFASGLFVSSAAATPPATLANGFVTDEASALTAAEISAANERLSQLASGDRGDLYVVFVDEFTDPSTSREWADRTAIENGLGQHQYLLAVAVEARQYAFSYDDQGPLTDAELNRIESAVQDELGASDWSGAIFAAAGAFPGQSSGSGSASPFSPLVLLVLAVGVVLIIVFVIRARKKKRAPQQVASDPSDPYATISDADLERQAGSALVAADDAITSSRQEVGFAVAQYGDDATAPFTAIVATAQEKVGQAFSLKQKLDDELPDAPEQRRAWHIEIIQLCAAADDLLDENVDAFDQLRKLQAEAPEALSRLRERRAAAEALLPGLPAALGRLAEKYDAAALATVTDNPAQAQQRLALADAEIAEAEQEIAEGSRGEAAFSIRTAEQAVEQIEQLSTALATLGADLSALEDGVRALIADITADIAAARALPDTNGQLAAVAARAESHVASVRAALEHPGRNPQQMLDTLNAVNTEIDAVLGQARQSAEQAERERRLVAQRLAQAQAQIHAASDFITTRRGAIGATARTRLAEANAAYAEAVAAQSTDLTRAAERATRANNLAHEAISSAQSEVSAFSGGSWSTGYSTGYSSNRGGSDLGGAILGGIIGGLLSGGGSSRSSGWSSGSSGRSRSGRSGGRPSGFGGGSRGSGRSRSGRF